MFLQTGHRVSEGVEREFVGLTLEVAPALEFLVRPFFRKVGSYEQVVILVGKRSRRSVMSELFAPSERRIVLALVCEKAN